MRASTTLCVASASAALAQSTTLTLATLATFAASSVLRPAPNPLSPEGGLPPCPGGGMAWLPDGSPCDIGAGTPRPHPFLRYDASLLNARAFLEGAVLTRRRARERFEEGLRDGEALLRSEAEDALFVA